MLSMFSRLSRLSRLSMLSMLSMLSISGWYQYTYAYAYSAARDRSAPLVDYHLSSSRAPSRRSPAPSASSAARASAFACSTAIVHSARPESSLRGADASWKMRRRRDASRLARSRSPSRSTSADALSEDPEEEQPSTSSTDAASSEEPEPESGEAPGPPSSSAAASPIGTSRSRAPGTPPGGSVRARPPRAVPPAPAPPLRPRSRAPSARGRLPRLPLRVVPGAAARRFETLRVGSKRVGERLRRVERRAFPRRRFADDALASGHEHLEERRRRGVFEREPAFAVRVFRREGEPRVLILSRRRTVVYSDRFEAHVVGCCGGRLPLPKPPRGAGVVLTSGSSKRRDGEAHDAREDDEEEDGEEEDPLAGASPGARWVNGRLHPAPWFVPSAAGHQ